MCAAASASPTPLVIPCPSGPRRHLDPGVTCTSGWPGVFESHLAEGLEVVEGEVVAGEVEHRVLQRARVPVRQHEAVAVRPRRVRRVVRHHLDHSRCAIGAQPIAAPGWPELACCTMSAARTRT